MVCNVKPLHRKGTVVQGGLSMAVTTQHFNSIKKDQNNPGYDEKAKVCFDDNGRPKKAANDVERCHATTKKKTQCKLKAIPGTNYCPTHTK